MLLLLAISMVVFFGVFRYFDGSWFDANIYSGLQWFLASFLVTCLWWAVGSLSGPFVMQWLATFAVACITSFFSSCIAWTIDRAVDWFREKNMRCVYCDSTEVTTEKRNDIFETMTPNGCIVRLTAKVNVHHCCNCNHEFTSSQAERARTKAYEKFLKFYKKE